MISHDMDRTYKCHIVWLVPCIYKTRWWSNLSEDIHLEDKEADARINTKLELRDRDYEERK